MYFGWYRFLQESILNNVLLIAKTGQLRDGLQALLETLPCIGMVSITDNYTSALGYLSERCPALILVVGGPNIQDKKAVANMKDVCPQTRLLTLATDENDCRSIAESNADISLISGVKVSELSNTIEALLLEDCSSRMDESRVTDKRERSSAASSQ
jgi:DNA-binding NarL/FixJ family response regulator